MSARTIPAGIRRDVRRRCGYGCVLCGIPLYDYDHIRPWSETKTHEVENIALLCPLHHAEKTRGLLPPERVRAASESPHNIRAGITTPFGLNYGGGGAGAEIVIGGNQFTSHGSFAPIVVDDGPILAFVEEEGDLILYMILRDRTNIPRLIVTENQLVMTPNFWDIQFEGGVLTIREERGSVFLRVRFEPPGRVVIERAWLLCNGAAIVVDDSGIHVNSVTHTAQFSGNRVSGAAGITVGYCPSFPQAIPWLYFPFVDRFSPLPTEAPRVADGLT